MTPEMRNTGRYGIPEQDPAANVGGPIAVDRAIEILRQAVQNAGYVTPTQAALIRAIMS